jgi:hypothetical protein
MVILTGILTSRIGATFYLELNDPWRGEIPIASSPTAGAGTREARGA